MRIAIIISVVVVIIMIVYFYNKNQTAKREADIKIAEAIANTPIVPCVPFTTKQYDDALRNLRNKCYPNWLIPVVGIGAYSKCMAKGKEAIPAIKNC